MKKLILLIVMTLLVESCGFQVELDENSLLSSSSVTSSLTGDTTSFQVKGIKEQPLIEWTVRIASTSSLGSGSCKTQKEKTEKSGISFIGSSDLCDAFITSGTFGNPSFKLIDPRLNDADINFCYKIEFEEQEKTGCIQSFPISDFPTSFSVKSGLGFPVGDLTGDERCLSIFVDSNSNIYCGGYTTGSVFEANGGGRDIIIMKFDPLGSLLWGRQLGLTSYSLGEASGDEECLSIKVDSNENVFCGGYTNGDLGELNGSTTVTNRDALVFKLGSDGATQWLKQLGRNSPTNSGNLTRDEECLSLEIHNGDSFCVGYTGGSVEELNGSFGLAGLREDAFVMKLNSLGSVAWLRQLGFASRTHAYMSNQPNGDDRCTASGISSTGDIYCVGTTKSSLGDALSGSQEDIFIVKINSSASYEWVSQVGSSYTGTATGRDLVTSASASTTGEIFFTGHTNGSLADTNAGLTDIFYGKFNIDGSLGFLNQLGSTSGLAANGTDMAMSIHATSSGAAISGDTTSSLFEATDFNSDAFAFRIDLNGNVISQAQIGASSSLNSGAVLQGVDSCSGAFYKEGVGFYCAGYSTGDLVDTLAGGEDFLIFKLGESLEI